MVGKRVVIQSTTDKTGGESYNRPLWEKYIENGKPIALRNKLVEANIKLVHREAHKMWKTLCGKGTANGIEYDDLVSIGSMGLVSAIEKFDLSGDNYFLRYAVPFIKGRMLQYLRDKGPIIKLPRHRYDTLIRTKQARRTLEAEWLPLQSIGHIPSMYLYAYMVMEVGDETAYEMGYREWKKLVEQWDELKAVCSLESRVSGNRGSRGSGKDGEEGLCLGDMLDHMVGDLPEYGTYDSIGEPALSGVEMSEGESRGGEQSEDNSFSFSSVSISSTIERDIRLNALFRRLAKTRNKLWGEESTPNPFAL